MSKPVIRSIPTQAQVAGLLSGVRFAILDSAHLRTSHSSKFVPVKLTRRHFCDKLQHNRFLSEFGSDVETA